MRRVGVAELKNNLSRLLRSVEIGQTIEVMDRSRPIARIVPVDRRERVTIRPASRPFASVRDRTYTPLAPGIDSLDLLREERAEGVLPLDRR
jgi:prevent-host-death family protein